MSDDLEQRVNALEKQHAALESRVEIEMRHIDGRLKAMTGTLNGLDDKLDTTNLHLSKVNTTGELSKQHSSGNEKLIWGLIMFAGGAISFVAGKLL